MPKPELTLASRVVASPDQVSAALSGESVILGMRDGVYYGVDTVGTRVWELMTEPRTLGEIAGFIEAEFDVTPERAAADLLAFAQDLAEHGLITVVAA